MPEVWTPRDSGLISSNKKAETFISAGSSLTVNLDIKDRRRSYVCLKVGTFCLDGALGCGKHQLPFYLTTQVKQQFWRPTVHLPRVDILEIYVVT